MSKKRIPQDGRLTYLYQRLGQAIDSAMFADDPQQIADVFHSLSLGFHLDGREESPYLQGENAKHWVKRIKELIATSDEDSTHPRAKEMGTWWVRAGRMTKDEKHELARCMMELHAHIGWLGND